MNANTRLTVDMGVRVRDFFATRSFGVAKVDSLVLELDGKVVRSIALIEAEVAGHVAFHAATTVKGDLIDEICLGSLRHVARIGRAAASEKPELVGQFKLPTRHESVQKFRAGSHAILAVATANRELMLKRGLEVGALEALTNQLKEYDRAIAARNAALAAHTGARSELVTMTSEIIRVVNELEGTLLLRFREDANLRGAWKSARNVGRSDRQAKAEREARAKEYPA